MISLYKPIDTQKENILFLHGFLESSDTWLPFLNELSKFYNCILYDFPGHGENHNFPHHKMSFELICLDIINSLNTINIKSTHLVCHSMGGYFGCYLKENHSSYFKKVILSNSTLESDTQQQLIKRKKTKHIINSNLSLLCKLSFSSYKPEIKACKESICLSSNPAHLITLQNILANRKDFTSLYQQLPEDFFFIFGENDKQIPWQNTQIKTQKRQCILHNEGHTLPLNSLNKWISIVLNVLE